ncbi:MAG: helix-turn-helix transcriptional regulator [Oscillospiraceae bacterium]|nr:helix-turn-helix transcriptional regulator [Oscillospiraceae bacterium]
MSVSYNKLWKLLIDKGLNKTQLSKETGISSSTISKLGKNEQISMDSMLKICKVLDCNIGDIVDVVASDGGSSDMADEDVDNPQT